MSIQDLPPLETSRALAVRQVTYPETDLTESLLLPGKARRWIDRSGRQITGLRPIQSRALHAIKDAGGGFLPLSVGCGKSILCGLAGTVLDKKLSIILAPAGTVKQLRATLADWGQHFRLTRYKVESYSQLSQPRETNLIKDLIGDVHPRDVVIVCDEMHKLRHMTAARTKRFLRLFYEHEELAFVGLSGTITSNSLRDFSHLLGLALRENSPMPVDSGKASGGHLHAWAEVIDVKGQPDSYHWRVIHPLMEKFGDGPWPTLAKDRRDYARQAFQRRLESAPGVVCTKKSAVEMSLNIGRIEIPVPEAIQAAMDKVDTSGELPNGDPIVDDITKWRVLRQLSGGFAYYWDWPGGVVDWDWLDAKRNWDSHVRHELQRHAKDGYDSPALVERAVRAYVQFEAGAPMTTNIPQNADDLIGPLAQWDAQRHKKAPPTVPLWISSYLVDHAVAWVAKCRKPVLVWYESTALADELREHMPVYGSGDGAPSKVETCAVSIRAQGTGLDLQDWSVNLVLEPFSSGSTAEQCLGRTHRPGQMADEVEVWLYAHTDAFRDAIGKARDRARYIENTTGNQQKLCYGTWL